MNERAHDRLFACCGVAFVVLQLVGFAFGGPTHQLTVASTAAQINGALSRPASPLSWVGAYLNLLSIGFFLAFAVWAARKLGDGILGDLARAAGASYAALTTVSLAIMDAIAYRAGNGLDGQNARTLVTLNEATFVTTWFLLAFFLLAAGGLALTSGRRVLGWAAIGIALYALVAEVSVNNLGQFSVLLWFAWIVAASIALARTKRARAYRTSAAIAGTA